MRPNACVSHRGLWRRKITYIQEVKEEFMSKFKCSFSGLAADADSSGDTCQWDEFWFVLQAQNTMTAIAHLRLWLCLLGSGRT